MSKLKNSRVSTQTCFHHFLPVDINQLHEPSARLHCQYLDRIDYRHRVCPVYTMFNVRTTSVFGAIACLKCQNAKPPFG